jgi:cytochrome b involved in lipid metabolism
MGWLKIARHAVLQGSGEHIDDSFIITAQKNKVECVEDIATPHSAHRSPFDTAQLKSVIEHCESSTAEHLKSTPLSNRPFASLDTADSNLPFIAGSEVDAKRRHKDTAESLWIVIDNIVYDCSVFVNDHPGGDTVIKSFVGSDCSWQFWRFHGKEHLEEFGKGLRIGRTSGVQNRFKEPSAYIGLRGLNNDSDEW